MNTLEVLIKEVGELDEDIDAVFILQLLTIVKNHRANNRSEE